MEVYLTFDDGIQAGTEEVLAVLEETAVPATFFLIGMQVRYFHRNHSAKCQQLLQKIYEQHAIGNHSFSHAHHRYSDYYLHDGVLIDNKGNRRSVLHDFIKCRDEINPYLLNACGNLVNEEYLLCKNQQKPLARFPGRNTWYISIPEHYRVYTNGKDHFLRCEQGTQDKAEQLFNSGYEIFGWNAEWKMSFNLHNDILAISNSLSAFNEDGSVNEEAVHPDIDMYADDHSEKDRLLENEEAVLDKMSKSAVNGKIVLLMHERAFRKGCNGYETEAEKLRSLITLLKSMKVEFKTLDKYHTDTSFQPFSSK